MQGGEITTRKTIGDSLSNRNNSLNFLRLFLACVVLFSHAAGIAGFHFWVLMINQTSAAEVALYGFFAISGYLIAESVERHSPIGYLWRRCRRIFPGFIFCLLLTAFLFGVLAWTHGNHPGQGISFYFNAQESPFKYVVKTALLDNPYWYQHTIAGTPISYIPAWNGSIWSLYFEFLCYLLLLGLALLGILKRRMLALLSSISLWILVSVITITPSLSAHFNFLLRHPTEQLLRFFTIFLCASVMYLFREKIPDSGWLALACIPIYLVGILLPLGGRLPTAQFTPIDIFIPFLIYPVLWCGIHLPFRRVGSKNDYSYGIYIFGWPITELVITWNMQRFGVLPFELLCFACTIPFAAMSWWLIEKRSINFSPKLFK